MVETALDRTLVVIPCLNEEAHLPGLLSQLLAQTPGSVIVVADGGSRDRSRDIVLDLAAHHANLHLLDNPARLQSAAVNLAVRRYGAGLDWLVRVDAHCLYPDFYIDGLLAAAARHQATCVVVPMVTEGQACFQRGVAAAQNSVLGAGGSPHRKVGEGRFVDHGHHALMRVDLYGRVGGYDESFVANEDAELDLRLAQAGATHWLEPDMAITYFPRTAAGPLARQYFNYGAGRARTLMRHAMPLKARQMAPLVIAPALIAAGIGAVVAPVMPLAGLLMLPAAAWAALCLASGVLLALKDKRACTLSAGPAAMIMHAAWSFGFWTSRLIGSAPGKAPEPLHA
jgi:succinoglycan biosynthesis protein ExoA